MKINRRLLRELRAQQAAFALVVGSGLAAGVITVLQARVLSRVVSQVFLEDRSFWEAPGFLFLLLGLLLGRAILSWSSDACASAIAARIKANLRQRLFEHIFAQGPIGYQSDRQERTGELVSVLTDGIEALDAYISQYLPQLVLGAFVPLTFLAFILPLDLLSGAILLLTAPLIPVFMILIGNLAEALTKRQWLALSRMSAYFLDVIQGLSTLKTLGRSQEQAQKIHSVSERYRETTLGVLRVTFLSALVLEWVATISTALVAVQVGLRLLYGQGGLSFEEAFFILILAPEFYLPLRLLGTRFHAGMAGMEAAGRIYEILERPVRLNQIAGQRNQVPGAIHLSRATSLPTGVSLLPAPIRFENVSCTYPDGRSALEEISFCMQPGQKTALVGPSGAGKSTIAALLLGFLKPSSGSIQIGDMSLDQISVNEWRHHLAWVPQNPTLFRGTVADNIRLARPEASPEDIVQAAKQACAHEFIQALPQGYDTLIGERGARLSGGEAQRIALARAFLRDAPLLILDETTSSLDPETEALLQQATDRLAHGRMVLVIAHRLSTIDTADQILVLENGRLIESGTHAHLINLGGLYQRMVSAYPTIKNSLEPLQGIESDADPDRHSVDPGLSEQFESTLPSPTPQFPGSQALLLRLLKLAMPFVGRMAIAVLFGFLMVGSGIGLMATSAYIIARAALQPSIAELQVAIVGVRFFGLARGLFRYLERYVSHDVTLRLLGRLRVWFYQVLEPLAPARLMQFFSGDLLSRIVGDINSLESFYVRALAPPLVAVLTGLAIGVFLYSFDLRLALANLAFMAILGVGVPAWVGVAGKNQGQRLALLRADLSSAAVESIQGMADLLAFGQVSRQCCQVLSLSEKLVATQLRLALLTALQNASGSLLAGLAMTAVLTLAIPLVNTGHLDGVYLPVIVLAALSSFEAVLPLPQAAQNLGNNLQAASRLFHIVDAPPAAREPADPLPEPQEMGLEVRNLRFRYPSGQPAALYALNGVSFSLPVGHRLAIVGPSGSGKSTLIHLLLRFWDFDEGQILLGGRDLRGYASGTLHQRMSVVAQNTYLFAATVRENLLIARPKASEQMLIQAAQQAQIHEFIQTLPKGYDTWIGEHGLRLSAGQRQRLAIARALLKDAPLLLLDEPTANLDPATERQVLEALYSLMRGRTVLAVTHRLVGLEAMDEIIVLRAGKVVERGRHSEMLERNGLYRRMWELQNRALIFE